MSIIGQDLTVLEVSGDKLTDTGALQTAGPTASMRGSPHSAAFQRAASRCATATVARGWRNNRPVAIVGNDGTGLAQLRASWTIAWFEPA